MKDIEILENMRDEIYGAMQFEDNYQVSELEEEQFNALNLAIKALKERQADKEKIKELESDKEIKDKMIEMYIEHIYRSCDFDNRIKTKEQIKQYFENLAKVNLQSNKENIDTRDKKKKYQCEWNLKSNKESGEIDEC